MQVTDAIEINKREAKEACDNWCPDKNGCENCSRKAYHNLIDEALHEYKQHHFPPRWVKMSDADGVYYCCSICGEELPRVLVEPSTIDASYGKVESICPTKYCPNCGVKMERIKLIKED